MTSLTVNPFTGPVGPYDPNAIRGNDNVLGLALNDLNYGIYNVRRYKATGDGSTNDTTPILDAATDALAAGGELYFPLGTYRSAPLVFTTPLRIRAAPGTRIKLNSAVGGTAVLTFDFTGVGSGWAYGAGASELILDGNGLVADGLLLKGVISSYFPNVRATNVTGAGFHLAWAQLCKFINPICSGYVETFSTRPVNGLLADGASSSANTFDNCAFEFVTGAGILGQSLLNSTFVDGTSEGNNIGIELGVAGLTPFANNNTVIGMDLEDNAGGDIVLRATAFFNSFYNIAGGGATSGVSQLLGAQYNTFHGGSIGGLTLDSATIRNTIDSVKMIGAGRTITDTGTNNAYRGCYNLTDGVALPEKDVRARVTATPANGGTVTPDCALGRYMVVTAGAGVASFTLAAPTNPTDGVELDITIHNASGGACAISFPPVIRIAGWVDPANNKTRSLRIRYDAGYAAWYTIAMSSTDQPA
jgi:hypothetical protein